MKTAGGPDALENFRVLEDRIRRALEVLTETRREKTQLSDKLRKARSQIETLESEVRNLERERKAIRGRVEAMLREIETLETEQLKAARAGKEQQVV